MPERLRPGRGAGLGRATGWPVGPGTRWVGVDGFGAAGKSTLARRIAAALPGARIVAVDDFGRAGVRGWDRELFTAQVLEPLLAGRPARYQRWDLVADAGAGLGRGAARGAGRRRGGLGDRRPGAGAVGRHPLAGACRRPNGERRIRARDD